MSLSALAAVVPDNAIRFLGHDTHEHDEPHLIHVVSGRVRVVADGRPYTLEEKESLWLAARVPHSMTVLSEDGLALGPVLPAQVSPVQRVRRLGAVPAISEVLTASMVAAPASPEQVQPFRLALSQVLATLGRQYFAMVLPLHPVARAVAQDARRSRTSLAELARRHHMSERQLQRVFLEQTGLSFAQWRTRSRLNLAISELCEGADLPAAAARAGFADRSGLVKALVRETGVDADAWRRDPHAAFERGHR